MTSVHAILIVIIRLWAAGVLLSSVIFVSDFPIKILSGVLLTTHDIKLHLSTAIWFLAGALAWIFAPRFSHAVLPKQVGSSLSININADTLIAAGSFLIGVFYLVQYGPRLVIELVTYFVEFQRQARIDEYMPFGPVSINIEWKHLAREAGVFFAALFIMLRPAYLARIFNWLRNAGQYEEKTQSVGHSREGGNPVEE